MDTLDLHFKPTVSAFISATAQGTARELAAFGTRGDGKTWGAFGAMIAHAQTHHADGFPLPTKWLGAADTFQSHVSKTHDSLQAPGWYGLWQLRDGGHLAVFSVAGVDLVHLRLFGVEDQSGMDRLRAECHGLWFEEPAPSSVLVQSSGLSESAWGLGLTSQRLASHCHPAIMTLNYPDEEHWTWQRFVVQQHPGTKYFRIPPGELASAAQRAEWSRALANRPDMLRRLLEGHPGTLALGPQVAVGFNEDVHAPIGTRLRPNRAQPLWIGQDGGHTPTSVLAQREGPQIRVLAALSSEHAGMRQHVRDWLIPWLSEHMPWVIDGDRDFLHVVYDPTLNTDDAGDIDSNPLRVLRQLLPGTYRPGPTTWAGRLDPLLALLNVRDGLLIDPVQARGLVRALNGGWYYAAGPRGELTSIKAEPKKPNHPHEDYGDAFCYLIAGMQPSKLGRLSEQYQPHKPTRITQWNPLDHGRAPRVWPG